MQLQLNFGDFWWPQALQAVLEMIFGWVVLVVVAAVAMMDGPWKNRRQKSTFRDQGTESRLYTLYLNAAGK